MIPVQVDRSLPYEINKRFYLSRLFLMWILACWVVCKRFIFRKKLEINTYWFDGISRMCKQVKESAFSWKALEIVYNLRPQKTETLEEKITNYWNNLLNAQAVRNRLILTKHLIKNHCSDALKRKREVRLLSIASGSARAVIEAISELQQEGAETARIHVILLDRDPSAIEYSKELTRTYNVNVHIEYANVSTDMLEKITEQFHPNVVEMVGFLEYRPYGKAVELIQRIYHVMEPGGVFITSQIAPNPERHFLAIIMNWPMIYRTVRQFSDILEQGNFRSEYSFMIKEPLGIHAVAVCKKGLE